MTPAEQIDRDVAFIINYHLETLSSARHANRLYALLLEAFECGNAASADAKDRSIALYALIKLIELAHTPAAGAFQGRAALYLANCLKTGHCGNLHPLSADAVGLLKPEEFALLETAASYVQRQTPTASRIITSEDVSLMPLRKLFEYARNGQADQSQRFTYLWAIIKIFERSATPTANPDAENPDAAHYDAEISAQDRSDEALSCLISLAMRHGQPFRLEIMQYLNRCIQLQRDSQGHALSPTIQRNLKQALQQIVMDTYPPPPRGGAQTISP